MPVKGHPNYFATIIIRHDGSIYFYFHFQPPGSILFAFLFEMLWFGKFEIQCGLKLTSSTPDQWTPFFFSFFITSFFGRRRKQLFIFVKRCAQTPVFQWQLAFSQIGAKNGKNWQYRVTGKQPLHLNISKSNLIWYILIMYNTVVQFESVLYIKRDKFKSKKRMFVKWMSLYKKPVQLLYSILDFVMIVEFKILLMWKMGVYK